MRTRSRFRGFFGAGRATRWYALLGMVVIVTLGLVACGGSAVARPSSSGGDYPLPAATAAPAAARAPAAVAGGAPSSGASGSTSSVPATIPASAGSKIIHNGTIALEVKDVPAAIDASGRIAIDLGGYVSASSSQGTGDGVHGDVTLRVPADQYDSATMRLRGLGTKVLKETSTSQDVSDQYVDLVARQKTLQLTVNQLQTLLGQAKTVDDTLKVQTQLTTVQSDLERITGQINYLDNRAAFSTISVSLDLAANANLPTGWSFGRAVGDAWAGSLRGLQGFVELLINIVVGGWWLLLLLAGVIVLARWLIRRMPARPQMSRPMAAPAGFAAAPVGYAPYPAMYVAQPPGYAPQQPVAAPTDPAMPPGAVAAPLTDLPVPAAPVPAPDEGERA